MSDWKVTPVFKVKMLLYCAALMGLLCPSESPVGKDKLIIGTSKFVSYAVNISLLKL